jgi:hypothetical protein
MRITESQLRRVIREAIQGALQPGEPVDTLQAMRSLKPGDNITVGGKPKTVVELDTTSGTLVHVDQGKSSRKYMDYRLAVRYPDDSPDMIPEIQVNYVGSGIAPTKTRMAPRKRGLGSSFSYYD